MNKSPLTFSALREANCIRVGQFKNPHGQLAHAKPDGSDWSPSQWLQALVGELGEFANVRKKFERGDLTFEQYRISAEKEIADVQTYLDLLARRALDVGSEAHETGIDLGEATRAKFNEVSERVGADVFINNFGSIYRSDTLPVYGPTAGTADIIAFGASLLGHASTTDGMNEAEARAWVSACWQEWAATTASASDPLDWGQPDALYPDYRTGAPPVAAPVGHVEAGHLELLASDPVIGKYVRLYGAPFGDHRPTVPVYAQAIGKRPSVDTPTFRSLLSDWFTKAGGEDQDGADAALRVLVKHIDEDRK